MITDGVNLIHPDAIHVTFDSIEWKNIKRDL